MKSFQIPNILYHATYRPLLKSIKEHGLDSKRGKQLWEDSIPGIVYLSDDKHYAASFAETTDEDLPDTWFDEIIILKIDTNKIDRFKLSIDKNNSDEESFTFQYDGVIPFSAILGVEKYDF